MASTDPADPASSLHPDLIFATKPETTRQEFVAACKKLVKKEDSRLKRLHLEGSGGVENASLRCQVIDDVMRALFTYALTQHGKDAKVALVANGGYGRGLLNPCSDLDLLILLPSSAHKAGKNLKSFVDEILYPLWDLGFKVGHAARSISECIAEAKNNPHSRTTLFDSRFLCGDKTLFEKLQLKFRRDCIDKNLRSFFQDREQDIASRYKKYSSTVFLQEPDLKESPGGLRDYHNLIWISDALFATRDLNELQKKGVLSENAKDELKAAFDFIHRVRNDLHYRSGKGNDILTLRLQGQVTKSLKYPEKTILRRIESLMRDYYIHARHIHQHTQSVFEIAFLSWAITEKPSLRKWLKSPSEEESDYGHFTGKSERLFAKAEDVFKKDPTQLLHLFRLCQKHDLSPSPDLRKLIKAYLHLIDGKFRQNSTNRETFRDILEQKGDVGRALRLMHRVGFLGTWIPEFGQLDCLVQHEFFHRYTADEHTLRCIDELDNLVDSDLPEQGRFRKLFIDHQDSYALYIAILMHDTGRSEDVREHSDGSAYLADRLCKRLKINGDRRKLIMFLVVHHLSFWLFATKRDLSDPDVIAEFAGIVRNKHWLDSLLLFTYVDSRGTNETSWSPWKETLIIQLYRATRSYLLEGENEIHASVKAEFDELREKVFSKLGSKYMETATEHFDQMPKRYFRFKNATDVRAHIRAIWQFQERRKRRPDTQFEAAIQWVAYPNKGYTELVIVTENSPLLLEKTCCALAANEINILSADIYTRPDGLVLDIFRVTTKNRMAVEDEILELMVVQALYEIHTEEAYDPARHLVVKPNYLTQTAEGAIPFPVRAYADPDTDPRFTIIEVQAIDRVGLLHDLFHLLNKYGLQTIHSRIATEKGAALDAFYVLDSEGHRPTNPALLSNLTKEIQSIIGFSDTPVMAE